MDGLVGKCGPLPVRADSDELTVSMNDLMYEACVALINVGGATCEEQGQREDGEESQR